ncbi:hypothetical protein VIGAN_10196200 [Vigna angularis var. angularis]|uniref:Uncharacterized protein n=1 Tax=Vigna angularis var. angularis TaxID=157739 RepID=A0A0S3T5B7_PHAAN|nr:hypothetical protein VIGAN_10196200 [Vigna angularis var. angularis]
MLPNFFVVELHAVEFPFAAARNRGPNRTGPRMASFPGVKAGVAAGMPVIYLDFKSPFDLLMEAKPAFVIKNYKNHKFWDALYELEKAVPLIPRPKTAAEGINQKLRPSPPTNQVEEVEPYREASPPPAENQNQKQKPKPRDPAANLGEVSLISANLSLETHRANHHRNPKGCASVAVSLTSSAAADHPKAVASCPNVRERKLPYGCRAAPKEKKRRENYIFPSHERDEADIRRRGRKKLRFPI